MSQLVCDEPLLTAIRSVIHAKHYLTHEKHHLARRRGGHHHRHPVVSRTAL